MSDRPRALAIPSTTRSDLETWSGRFFPYVYRSIEKNGETRFSVTESVGRQIIAGYGCARCLADFEGVYRLVCPVCGNVRDLERDVAAEPDWEKPDPNDPYRNA